MATILSKEQCDRISSIRSKIRQLSCDDWMCEGSDLPGYCCNALFNNELDQFFLADYRGNIIEARDVTITPVLRELARLYGEIRLICNE